MYILSQKKYITESTSKEWIVDTTRADALKMSLKEAEALRKELKKDKDVIGWEVDWEIEEV